MVEAFHDVATVSGTYDTFMHFEQSRKPTHIVALTIWNACLNMNF